MAERWAERPGLRPGCKAWSYLIKERRLPTAVLGLAAQQDSVRDGVYGSAWFAHRDASQVAHVEIRGPGFKGSLKGGRKTLFRLRPGTAEIKRLVIAEAPIDALSVAAIEQLRTDSLYVATGGGMGPGTLAALQEICVELAARPGSVVESAADANHAGDRYAELMPRSRGYGPSDRGIGRGASNREPAK